MLQFMRGESSVVSANDPVLAAGQPFYELDTNKLKIGNGTSRYSQLEYLGGSSSSSGSCPFPVDAVMIFTVNQNPNTIWSGTTWEMFAQGKTLIGMDSANNDYATVLKTGGQDTINLSHTHGTSSHTLTTSEIPSHTHSFGSHTHSMTHTHSLSNLSTSTAPAHDHQVPGHYTGYSGHQLSDNYNQIRVLAWKNASSYVKGDIKISNDPNDRIAPASGSDWGAQTFTFADYHRHAVVGFNTGERGAHSHTVSGSLSQYSGSTGSASGTSGSTGSGSGHTHGDTTSALSTQSIVSSYVVVCFWLRTA